MYTKEAFTYSDQDRLLTHTHQIGAGGTPQLLASNTYDELGQLIGKNVGNTLAVPLQKVNYAYNIRGWLTGVNNDPTNNLVLNTSEKDLFGFKINYNTVQNETGYTGKSLYNGNISETYWRVSSDNVLRKYGYKYDNLNRLRESIYQKPGNSNPVPKSYDENLTYDKNGNILSLLRNGDIDGALPPNNIDNLVYTYASNANKLLSVLDTSNNNIAGFVDTNKSNDDYTYDANGNLITDKNKNITAIVYNHLNLPTKITFGTTGNIVYIYNANGQKLEKIVTQGTSVTNTNYLGGYQYSKPNLGTWALQFFPTAEGYVKNTNGIYSYVFNYTDHLGNVRLSYSDTSKNGLIETNEIVDESHYYPFGLKHSGYVTAVPDPNYKYKYNGKELQDENIGGNQLNLYDYGARNYDPALGRWMNVDPLAELSRRFSPYTYANNNPVYFIDPDGMYSTAEWKKDNGVKDSDLTTIYQAPSSESASESPPDDYVFNEKGDYVRTDKNDKPNKLVVENSKTGEKTNYGFADPIEDPKNIDSGFINKLEFVSLSKIMDMIQQQGGFNAKNGSWMAFYQQSKGGQNFDYTFSVLATTFHNSASSLFLPKGGDGLAHNLMNFGNFLWAATGYSLGYDYSTLKMGAHLNSLFNSSSNGYSPQLDSKDDQRSILSGAAYSAMYGFRFNVKK